MKCKRSSAGSIQGLFGYASVDFVREKNPPGKYELHISLIMCSREAADFSRVLIVMCSTMNRLLKIMVILLKYDGKKTHQD